MIKRIDFKSMGRSDLGWLRSTFHFSFADYYNENNMNFGVLRVINDDLVESNGGFDTHGHRNMEIISYIVNGELTHGDSMGNKRTLSRGSVQYMSAGRGVLHSEHNFGPDILRFLQIWILPDKDEYEPNYGDYEFNYEERKNKWLNIVSGKNGCAPIKINQDVNIYVLELDEGNNIDFEVKEGRQAYLVQIEGSSQINGVDLNYKDAMEIVEEDIRIYSTEKLHFIVIEMKKSI